MLLQVFHVTLYFFSLFYFLGNFFKNGLKFGGCTGSGCGAVIGIMVFRYGWYNGVLVVTYYLLLVTFYFGRCRLLGGFIGVLYWCS